jgi:hypothetical protein
LANADVSVRSSYPRVRRGFSCSRQISGFGDAPEDRAADGPYIKFEFNDEPERTGVLRDSQGKQYVFRCHLVLAKRECLVPRSRKRSFGTSAKFKLVVGAVARGGAAVELADECSGGLEAYTHRSQDLAADPVGLIEQSQEEVLRADIWMPE